MKAAASLLLALLTLPAWGAQEEAPPPAFSGGTQVLSVEIPVQVVRGGEPVRGLTTGDFEVWEGRRRVPVSGFEVLDLAAVSGVLPGALGGAPAPAVPAAARRHFLFLFDLAFTDPSSILRARQAAAGLLGRLHPADLVAVATYSATRGAQLALGFTADRRQIDVALGSLGLPGLTARPLDPLRLVVGEALGAGNAAGGGVVPLSRDPLSQATDAATLLKLDAITSSVEGADRVALRGHVDRFTRSLSRPRPPDGRGGGAQVPGLPFRGVRRRPDPGYARRGAPGGDARERPPRRVLAHRPGGALRPGRHRQRPGAHAGGDAAGRLRHPGRGRRRPAGGRRASEGCRAWAAATAC